MTLSTRTGALLPAVLSFVFGVGCESDFAPYNEVDGFRLLAIAADPPQLTPGGAVALRSLVVGDDAPAFVWRWCPVTLGATEEHRCAIEVDGAEISTSTTAMLAWPRDFDALCEQAATTNAPADAPRLDCTADRPELYVHVEVTASTGERIVALRPVPLAPNSGPLNENPRIDGVRFATDGEMAPFVDDTPLPTATAIDLELAIDPSTAETNDDGTQEILRTTWFVSGGETDAERTTFIPNDPTATFERLATNSWTLPEAGRDAALYLVIRDDRGGTSWIERHAVLEGGDR